MVARIDFLLVSIVADDGARTISICGDAGVGLSVDLSVGRVVPT